LKIFAHNKYKSLTQQVRYH